jgi:zinc D-Ala-D-Ala carboxypeptidase
MSDALEPSAIRARLMQMPLTPPAGDQMIWLPVGKTRPLPPGYAPPDLVLLDRDEIPSTRPALIREVVVNDLANMLVAAATHGHYYRVVSAYRSEEYQREVFSRFVQRELETDASALHAAEQRANRYSAQAGYSEHQLGTTVDLSIEALEYRLTADLGATPEGLGLLDNAWRYGFLHSYPDGSETRTGYMYEPWHLRWVGRPLAARIHGDGYLRDGCWDPSQPTLEEYLAALWQSSGEPKATAPRE